MFTLHLKNLKFISFHGIHEEEKILGNEYEVNVDIKINQVEKIDSIHQTINYVSVYELIKARMSVPTPLLEILVHDIAEQIHQLDQRILSIQISVFKLHPPIENIKGSVGVSWYKEY